MVDPFVGRRIVVLFGVRRSDRCRVNVRFTSSAGWTYQSGCGRAKDHRNSAFRADIRCIIPWCRRRILVRSVIDQIRVFHALQWAQMWFASTRGLKILHQCYQNDIVDRSRCDGRCAFSDRNTSQTRQPVSCFFRNALF